jgi:hypothetical protein
MFNIRCIDDAEVYRTTPGQVLVHVWGSADKPSCIGFGGVPTIYVRGLLLVERISDQYESSLFNVNPYHSGCWAGCMTISLENCTLNSCCMTQGLGIGHG